MSAFPSRTKKSAVNMRPELRPHMFVVTDYGAVPVYDFTSLARRDPLKTGEECEVIVICKGEDNVRQR